MLVLRNPELTATRTLNPAIAAATESTLGGLLNLFPAARRLYVTVTVDLPIRVKGASEKTTILFGTPDTAIFLLKFPVGSGTKLSLRPVAESRAAQAVVDAVMLCEQGLAVAVRFQHVPKWFNEARGICPAAQRNPSYTRIQ